MKKGLPKDKELQKVIDELWIFVREVQAERNKACLNNPFLESKREGERNMAMAVDQRIANHVSPEVKKAQC